MRIETSLKISCRAETSQKEGVLPYLSGPVPAAEPLCMLLDSLAKHAILDPTTLAGVTLVQRDIQQMQLRLEGGDVATFAILAIFPFTSASKRMGIVVRNMATGLITFYEKGADSVMQNIVRPSNWLEEECTNLAQEGLRTLVFGVPLCGLANPWGGRVVTAKGHGGNRCRAQFSRKERRVETTGGGGSPRFWYATPPPPSLPSGPT